MILWDDPSSVLSDPALTRSLKLPNPHGIPPRQRIGTCTMLIHPPRHCYTSLNLRYLSVQPWWHMRAAEQRYMSDHACNRYE